MKELGAGIYPAPRKGVLQMKANTKTKAVASENEAFYKEPVPVMLIKDNAKYKDDVTVTVNGTNYQIQRGVPVTVPRCVALVLERSHNQELEAQAYMESLKG